MLCCLNPACHNPPAPDGTRFCTNCGVPLVVLRNRYRPIKPLGDGGFGKTYLAEDIDKLNQKCVIKQFAPQFQGTGALQKATALFEQEARRLEQLGEHPQIPTLLAYFQEDNRLYLVQQFIDGKNLLKQLTEQGTFSERKIRNLLEDLLNILQVVHQQQVIHRDIKPENIIERIDGKVVLIDFGASKQLTQTAMSTRGTTIGSYGYAPLEQMQGGEAYPASDLFSLGATCFHLLSGIKPWELWKSQGYGWVRDWRKHLQQPISQELGQIIDKLLQEDYQQRYQFVQQVLADLNPPVTPPPPPPPPSTPPPIPDIPKKTFPKYLLLLPLFIMIGAGSVYFGVHINQANNYHNQGIEKYNKQDFQGAIEAYNQAIKINPNYAEAYYQRGIVRSDLGEKQAALEDYNQAIKINPNYAEVYYQRGISYVEQDQQKAIADFRRAAELFAAQGKQADAKRSQGVERFYLQDYQGALSAYTEAINLNSNDFRAYINRGNTHRALQDNQAAIADYNQAIKINPNYAITYNNRGAAHNDLGDKQAALADYNEAIRLNPHYAWAYSGRGNVRNDLGDKQAALADYNQAIKIDPNHAWSYNGRGNVYYDLGNKQAALADYNQAIKINSNYAQAYFGRGLVHNDSGNKQAALADYNQAIRINPNYAAAYNNRGVVHSSLGNQQAALADYNQAIGISPNYALAYNNRGLIHSSLNDKQSAIADFRRAANLYKQQGRDKDYRDVLNRIQRIDE
jgi:tetratricopeptide (TPR) repeat protein